MTCKWQPQGSGILYQYLEWAIFDEEPKCRMLLITAETAVIFPRFAILPPPLA